MTEITDKLSTALADRYKIERHLGEGGMATVYLAEDLKHKRKVAVKVLRPELAAVLGAERFVQEITTTANLQHPHILPLFDSGEADSFLYYVMPYVEGETLRDKLNRETQLGIDEAVRITTEVADALDYAHRHNVIHRDIKPENILLHDGRPMVADFGIALAVSAAAGGRMTETGMSLGTPHYMSPEQATAEKDLTNRSDIYSLGCVLYEMLTGEPPHTGASAQAIVMKIVTDDVRPVTELRKSVPPHVAAATANALEKLPADRFKTAQDLAKALADPRFRHGEPAGVEGTAGAGPWKRLSVVSTALAATFALLLGWSLLRPEAPPPQTVRTAIPLPPPEELSPVGIGSSIVFSPDGKTLVYLATGGVSDLGGAVPLLMRRELDRLQAAPVGAPERARRPFFSPDGEWIGFESDGKLTKMPWEGGQPVTIYDAPFEVGRSIALASWSETDTIVFGLSGNYPLMQIPATGGSAEPVTTLDTDRGETDHRHPEMLPGGRSLLFTAWSGGTSSGQIAAQSLGTGERRDLVVGVSPRYVATGHILFARDGTLWIVPFDVDHLDVTGPAVQLEEDVQAGLVDFALGPDGTLAYARRSAVASGGRRLVWVDREGNEETVTREPGAYQQPRLSPDGERVAVVIGRDIWIHDLARGTQRQLTFDPGADLYPLWTPDGERVVFGSSRESQDGVTRNLWWRAADGTGQAERLTTNDNRTQSPWTWSRDGTMLVFQEGAPNTSRWDLGLLSFGDEPRTGPLVDTEASELFADISPDGAWIAFNSNESGQREVWVRPFPNVDDGRWKITTDGGTDPLWGPSGRELFYRTFDPRAMMVIAIETEPELSWGIPERLFEGEGYFVGADPTYDVSLNGQRFLIVKNVESIDEASAVTQLILVQNWFEELKAKVGNE